MISTIPTPTLLTAEFHLPIGIIALPYGKITMTYDFDTDAYNIRLDGIAADSISTIVSAECCDLILRRGDMIVRDHACFVLESNPSDGTITLSTERRVVLTTSRMKRRCTECSMEGLAHYYTSQRDGRDLCEACFEMRKDKQLAKEVEPARLAKTKNPHPLDVIQGMV